MVPDSDSENKKIQGEATAGEESPSPPAAPSKDSSAAPVEEPLPEWEELTPELMEDECLRGDSMLRGALVLLALLLGWTYLTESGLLVNIRTGEYILSHGGLPPRGDVFSATVEGRPWVNLGWLSDVILAGLSGLLGMGWLSVLCALTVAVSIWCLTRITFPRVSTWWGSVCGALALLALLPEYQPGSATFTILGLSILMLLLARGTTAPECRSLWGLPVLFLFWTNLDPRAWIGMALLTLFAATALLVPGAAPGWRRRLGIIVGLSLLLGLLASPWPGAPATAGLTMYRAAAEAQAYNSAIDFFPRLTYGYLDIGFWRRLDFFAVASLTLLLASLVTLVLNARRIYWGWLAVWLAMNLLSLFFGDVVCYAAIVNAVVATLNGQDWYRHRFSQEYRVDTWSVAYARGGRAVTVLSLFLLAYLSVNGALMGAGGRRIGTGLDPRWSSRIESLRPLITERSYGENIFPTLPEQGDLVLWLGKKPFVDSRFGLYLSGPPNLLAVHRAARLALFPDPGGEVPPASQWKEPLDKYKTYDVVTRLWGNPPPYRPLFQLLVNNDWVLSGLSASGANFTRADVQDEPLKEHRKKYQLARFSLQAFRPDDKLKTVDLPAQFPVAPSTYDRWLMQKLPHSPAAAELARHQNAIAVQFSRFLSPQQVTGLMYLALRNCREAIAENPQDPLAYRVQTHCYQSLQQFEQVVARAGNGAADPELRAIQARSAAFNAVAAGGNDPQDRFELFQLLIAQKNLDTAKDLWDDLLNDRHFVLPLTEAEIPEFEKLLENLSTHVIDVRNQIDDARVTGEAQPGELVNMALRGSCPKLALSLLEEDLTRLSQNPPLQLLYASLLFQVGRLQEAWEQLESLGEIMPKGEVPPEAIAIVTQWRSSLALANVAGNNLDRALRLWHDDQSMHQEAAISSLLQQPFSSAQAPVQQDLWATIEARATVMAIVEVPERWAQLQLQSAQSQLEIGRLPEATALLETLLERNPEFTGRPVVVYYLTMLTDKKYDVSPPSDRIPVWPEMFAPDEPEQETPPATTEESPSAAPATQPPPLEPPQANDASKP